MCRLREVNDMKVFPGRGAGSEPRTLSEEAGETMGRDHHVVKRGQRWVVVATGGRQALSSHASRTAAIEAARRLARYEGGALVVHR